LQGFAEFSVPDLVLREEQLAMGLAQLCDQIGIKGPDAPAIPPPEAPATLAEIYDEEIEKACKDAYMRDYMMFGYGPWQQG
jgi:hypothetical protein